MAFDTPTKRLSGSDKSGLVPHRSERKDSDSPKELRAFKAPESEAYAKQVREAVEGLKRTYRDYERGLKEIRTEGHERFPGTKNSVARHQWASEEGTRRYGGWVTRMAGVVNELQGLWMHDLGFYNSTTGEFDYFSRSPTEIVNRVAERYRNGTMAFQFEDLAANEVGIGRGQRDGRGEGPEHWRPEPPPQQPETPPEPPPTPDPPSPEPDSAPVETPTPGQAAEMPSEPVMEQPTIYMGGELGVEAQREDAEREVERQRAEKARRDEDRRREAEERKKKSQSTQGGEREGGWNLGPGTRDDTPVGGPDYSDHC